MRNKKTARMFLPLLLAALFLAAAPCAQAEGDEVNRFNVSIIVDASGSMKYTDPEKLRFDAIQNFMSLLTEQGNVVGGVVFSTGIDAQTPLTRITGEADKDRIVADLEAVPANGMWTNIGEALMTSVQSLIRDGDPEKDSVILFLSDGNTDMDTDRERQVSMERQAEAIQLARQHNIKIYSICLNVNGTADTDEMRRISGSEALFQNISSAADLWEAFNKFHTMIYGVSTVTLFEGEIPNGGELRTKFDVPGVGVEEVNIFIYGDVKNMTVTKPDGTVYTGAPKRRNAVTSLKITDIMQGEWELYSEGVPKERIKINMKYNSDMALDVKVSPPENGAYTAGEKQVVSLILKSGSTPGSAESYRDYTADLLVTDVQGNTLSTIPMKQEGDHFQSEVELPEGAYFFIVRVLGKYDMEKMSDSIKIEVEQPQNHPPVPVNETISENVTVWPVRTQPYQLDLKTLATDPDEGDTLTYTVTESSFLAGEDYSVDENQILTLQRFGRLPRGMFEITATDSGGESCAIQVNLQIRFVAFFVAAGIGVAAALALLILILLIRRSFGVAFMGSVTASNIATGVRDTITPNRGRVRLRAFEIGDAGLSGRCYFQATGRDYVNFIVPWPARPVYNEMGRRTRRVQIENDMDTGIFANADLTNGVNVYFKSDLGGDDMSF